MLLRKTEKADAIMSLAERVYACGKWLVLGGGGLGGVAGYFSPLVEVFGAPIAVGIGVLILLANVSIILGISKTLIQSKSPPPLREVVRQHFSKQTVLLDGSSYIDCVFDACTLVYAGGDYHLESEVGDDCRIEFKSKTAIAAVKLLYHFSLLRDNKHQLALLDKHGRPEKPAEIIHRAHSQRSNSPRQDQGVHQGTLEPEGR